MKVIFEARALEDLTWWRRTNPAYYERIKKPVASIEQEPFSGIGKPEPLKHELAGAWSRRIDREHRMVYRVKEGIVQVLSCRYHY